MKIEKYSIGVGDRFAHQAKAQLQAFVRAASEGAPAVPVWNKSNREHNIVGSEPSSVRAAADQAVKDLGWTKAYYVDADHINLTTVDRFLAPSNFFTLDVADAIGKPASPESVDAFLAKHPELIGTVQIPDIAEPFHITCDAAKATANKFLFAVQEAGTIYRKIESSKGKGTFITEVSMDETDSPQTPPELLLILAAIADEGIPIQTIAPKFTGRFNKGVDYVGDIVQFEKEFGDDLAVLAFAIKQYGLPDSLKLSVHSGSDKFSIYAPIRRQLLRFGAGLHLKTAGTTWLEELIGLAEAGPEGLAMAKEIYSEAYSHREELCAPYASVIDVDPARLPTPEAVNGWTSEQYSGALRHDQTNPAFNAHLRQLLHVGFKVAAKMGPRYLTMLDKCEESIAKNVTENLYERHLKPLFLA
jgi:tagaturonate epimerase